MEAVPSDSPNGTSYKLWIGGNGLEINNRSDL